MLQVTELQEEIPVLKATVNSISNEIEKVNQEIIEVFFYGYHCSNLEQSNLPYVDTSLI